MRTASAIGNFLENNKNGWGIAAVVALLPFAVIGIVFEAHLNALELSIESLCSAIPMK